MQWQGELWTGKPSQTAVLSAEGFWGAATEGNERRLMVTYGLCWRCAAAARVTWAIYSARCENKKARRINTSAWYGLRARYRVHCFPTGSLKTDIKLFGWPPDHGSLASGKLSATQGTHVHSGRPFHSAPSCFILSSGWRSESPSVTTQTWNRPGTDLEQTWNRQVDLRGLSPGVSRLHYQELFLAIF